MAELPRLKVDGGAFNGIYDLEEAKNFPFGQFILVVEQYVIGSYEDLVHLAKRPEFKNREYLIVEFVDIISGG